MAYSRDYGSDFSHRQVRKRPRDDYEGWCCELCHPCGSWLPGTHYAHTAIDAPRYKRGRYSDPGSRSKDPEVSAEQRLESLITRLGEKVKKFFFLKKGAA